MPSRTPYSLKLRLYVMMFLQYFVQGCFLPVISVYVEEALGFSAKQLGYFSAAMALGPLVAAFAAGQLVDRRFQTQHVLAVSHLLGGALMLLLYTLHGFVVVTVLGAVYAVLYAPSIMLTNSLTFHHLADREREFPLIRVWGTIGFIAPAWLIESFVLAGKEGAELNEARGIVLVFAGVAGLVMAIYSFTLPRTPPQQGQSGEFAPLAVLRMLFRRRSFLVLVLVSFGVAIVHKFFFVWNSPYLKAMLRSGGETGAWEGRISSIGQIAEIAVMTGLGLMILRVGFKWTMTLGIAAYLLRCLIFAAAPLLGDFAPAMTAICLGQALHGFCFGCFLAAAFMYVDREAPSDARGSMQTFYGTFVLTLGFFVGGFVGGYVGDAFTHSADDNAPSLRQQWNIESTAGVLPVEQKKNPAPDEATQSSAVKYRDWPAIWLASAAMALLCLLVFLAAFPREKVQEEDVGQPQ